MLAVLEENTTQYRGGFTALTSTPRRVRELRNHIEKTRSALSNAKSAQRIGRSSSPSAAPRRRDCACAVRKRW